MNERAFKEFTDDQICQDQSSRPCRTSTMVFAAEDEAGGLRVRIGLDAWEQLRMAMPALDDDDRRDAALFELEQLSTPNRTHLIDGERVVDIMIEDIEAIVARIEAQLQR